MSSIYNLILCFCIIFGCESTYTSDELKINVTNGIYAVPFSVVIDKSTEYIIVYSQQSTSIYPARVTVLSPNASRLRPVLVVVRQQRGVLSWQLPLIVETRGTGLDFNQTSRTLCPNQHYASGKNKELSQIVSISTASEEPVNVTVRVDEDTTFFINDSTNYEAVISPSEPKYYFYNFVDKNISSTELNYETVVLEVNSKDNICMMISIQNISCPVYDLEREVQFEGYWETMTTRGGITLTREKFPNGFYVVFVVKGDDYECNGINTEANDGHSRNKSVTFSIIPSISYVDYINATMITLSLVGVFYFIFLGMLCYFARRHYRPMSMDTLDDTAGPSTAANDTDEGAISACLDDSSLEDYDTINEYVLDKDIYRTKIVLCVADLARKSPEVLKTRSNLYLWNVLTVAVFYGLPVIQLVIRYQSVLNDSGNQDLCYYNFLCAHPVGFLSDFNHVFSNIGYIGLGLLFVFLVYRRERMHRDNIFDMSFGIPQHYGLFYAMGVGLIMEGILSGSYHVCPNHYNFQFDSSFMYVMAVLCMVKIYQTRHPDINARAHATFGVLAGAIFLGMVGILDGSITFWIVFTVIHVITCLLLSAQIYYLGRWKLDGGIFRRIYFECMNDLRAGPLNIFKPHYKGRLFLLFVGNVCNWGFAYLGLTHHDRDFATYLLAIFMGNTVLYTIFYIIMKIVHRETIQFHAGIFILLAFATWGASLYFFINKSISWALTPAESRQYNQGCILLRFYDNHDVWHFLSSSAMFFSFMVLLTLDDDLSHTHRTKIAVF